MTDTVNIGGVNFNKKAVKSSEKIKQGEKELNSVFLNNGTKLVYPNQDKNGKSEVKINEIKKTIPTGMSISPNGTVNAGLTPGSVPLNMTVGSGNYRTTFNNLIDTKVTGTDKKDTYNFKGCINTNVDMSQNDKKTDITSFEDSDEYRSMNNQVKQNDEDVAGFINREKEGFFDSKYKKVKGSGTFKENDY